ncbi:serine/threonine protein kinase [compost metagenome]
MNDLDRLKRSISETYDLEVKHIELIYNAINKIFRITSNNGTLILKLFKKNDHSNYKISFERKVMLHIFFHQINIIEPIPPASPQEQIYQFENQLYFGILTRECSGDLYFTKNNTQTHNYLFGQILFKLHNSPPPSLRNPKYDTTNSEHLILKLEKSNHSWQVFQLKQIIDTLYTNIKETTQSHTESVRKCICHGDAWPGNALYFSKTCTLIDFEHTRISDPAFDIATFIWWLSGSEYKESEKFKAWECFTRGYGDSINQLLNRKLSTLIKINQLRSLVFLHNNIIISDEILEHARHQTLDLLKKLTQPLNNKQQLETLWKK